LPVPDRIIFVRQSHSAHGGGELILGRLIAALQARGLEVTLMARQWGDLPPGVSFIRCDPPARGRAGRELAFVTSACALLEREPAALVQAHERLACADIYRAGDGTHAAFLDAMKQAKGGLSALRYRLSPFHRNRLKLERALFASRRLRAVIVNSSMVGDDIARRYRFPRERIHRVNNGIDLAHYQQSQSAMYRDDLRAELGTSSGRSVLLFAGSGYERKGLSMALRVLAGLPPDVELWVVGNDRNPARFHKLATRLGVAGRTRFLGARSDLLPLYAAADALILPALYDPFPSTVIEALASGLPVVTSRSCGAAEVAARLDPRLIADSLDVGAMTEGARIALALATTPEARARARALAAPFSVEAMLDQTLAVYEQVSRG
jgi:UDP-glucose:(heptosyl)LPS alpha-1,3-glucosyltransferase